MAASECAWIHGCFDTRIRVLSQIATFKGNERDLGTLIVSVIFTLYAESGTLARDIALEIPPRSHLHGLVHVLAGTCLVAGGM